MDKMLIEILPDGTLKIITDKVSMPNHTNAEGLIRELSKGMGGATERIKRNAHTHDHEHHQEQ